ncbi:MAG: NAD(P)-dependent oxidoreductase [Planctomycetota bacterium]|nr:NAD(P)-dependent oxidoreductase [Planctomycetota bacterium]
MATHRRQFLKAIAASGMASSCMVQAAAGQAALETSPEAPSNPASQAVGSHEEVLLTSAESPFGRSLVEGLGATCRLRLTARTAVPGRAAVLVSDLGADNATRSLVRGVEGIVHLPGAYSPSDAAVSLDYCTRSTYNLLQAAAQDGVKNLVYLSSLAVMAGYPEEFTVDEDWRPSAKGGSPGLAEYLGEVVCREFAREGKIQVVVLRLGKVVRARETVGQPFDPLWVEQADVIQAVSLALTAQRDKSGSRLGAWSVFHIVSASQRTRYSSEKAKRVLGYRPQFAGGER